MSLHLSIHDPIGLSEKDREAGTAANAAEVETRVCSSFTIS
jgi:hypothetical protein